MLDIFENIIYNFHTYKMKASSSINKKWNINMFLTWKALEKLFTFVAPQKLKRP